MLVLLLLACLTVITLDARGGADSPVNPVRSAVGDFFGPIEEVTAAVVRPVAAVPEFFRTTGGLRSDVVRLEAENDALRSQLATSTVARNRAAELDGLLATSRHSGYSLVPSRVIAMGPAQSFSRTVTIDAGTSSGVRPDMTVLNNDGLVGRVLRADRSTATVLLVVDPDSVVGGRLGSTMEIGFLRGLGRVSDDSLELDLVDTSAAPERGDVLVTWGSRDGAPYVAGVPIGTVASVTSSPRQLSREAEIRPFVDFTSLDLVGVVVDPGTASDRSLIEAGRTTGTGEGR
ncbi:rod shape-determining protein MreC [Nocardioides mesophilus]|uniref:Cell shape-determining protein MreC n=1 Tax=Nocardioides mesophilus TaxID=433659 RepID=A0A7G9RCR9_9ACTN|nr:rod shape-determining protein MreC [Nocardioides mesophilus]QNN53394.1 rod shape-determining protein MreC [Nocardioides mesophilus]